jgi:mannosyltransferase
LNPHDVLDDPVAEPQVLEPSQPSVAQSRAKARLRWLIGRVWLWPTLLTFGLGAARIGWPELWRDELRSWSAASRSTDQILHLLGHTDAAVALYYLVLHYWMQVFGDSATSMRMVSNLAMAGATAMVCLIGQRLFNRKAAMLAGFVFALIPAVSRFAQEVRPYAITILVAGLSTLLLLRAIEKQSWRRFVLYGVSLALLALTQIVAMPILLAHAVAILLWRKDRRDWRLVLRWGVGVAIGLALAAPVVLASSAQYAHQVGSLPDATFGELTKLPSRLFASYAVGGAVIVLAVFAFTTRWRPVVFLGAWAILPIVAIWVASNLGQSYWMSRYMLFTLPAFALLAGAGLATLNKRVAAAGLVVIAMLGVQDQRLLRWIGAHDQWTYPEFANNAVLYSDMATIIADNQKPGDGIVFVDRTSYWLLDIGLQYHLRGQPQPKDVLVEQSSVDRGDFWPIECTFPAECLAGTNRLFVVGINLANPDIFVDMESAKKAILLSDFTIEREWDKSGIGIVLMQRKAGS